MWRRRIAYVQRGRGRLDGRWETTKRVPQCAVWTRRRGERMDGRVEAHTPSFAWRVSLPFSASTRMTDSEYAQAEDSDRHGQRCTTAHARADPPPSLPPSTHTHTHTTRSVSQAAASKGIKVYLVFFHVYPPCVSSPSSLYSTAGPHAHTHTHNTTCLPFLPHPPPPHLKPLLLPSHTLTPCSPVVPIAFHLSVSLHPRPLSCIIDHSRARERMKGQESVKLR